MNNQELISTAQAAEIMGISRVAVLKQIKSGKLPAENIQGRFLINRKDLPEVLQTEVSPQAKKDVKRAVNRTVKEYGETLRKLGRE